MSNDAGEKGRRGKENFPYLKDRKAEVSLPERKGGKAPHTVYYSREPKKVLFHAHIKRN